MANSRWLVATEGHWGSRRFVSRQVDFGVKLFDPSGFVSWLLLHRGIGPQDIAREYPVIFRIYRSFIVAAKRRQSVADSAQYKLGSGMCRQNGSERDGCAKEDFGH